MFPKTYTATDINECEICGKLLHNYSKYFLDPIGRVMCLECKDTKEEDNDEL